jgi:hypothetical protein
VNAKRSVWAGGSGLSWERIRALTGLSEPTEKTERVRPVPVRCQACRAWLTPEESERAMHGGRPECSGCSVR